MPKQPHKMLLGVFDEYAYVIMGSLTGSTKSFSDLLTITKLPKSSLYMTLMKLVENDLVVRNGAYFTLSSKGYALYNAIHEIVVKGNLPQVRTEVTRETQKESTIGKIFGSIRKIFGR
ncbi:MAG: hypothetical protein ACUVQ8_03990 [Nitrososphaeria archaeon]